MASSKKIRPITETCFSPTHLRPESSMSDAIETKMLRSQPPKQEKVFSSSRELIFSSISETILWPGSVMSHNRCIGTSVSLCSCSSLFYFTDKLDSFRFGPWSNTCSCVPSSRSTISVWYHISMMRSSHSSYPIWYSQTRLSSCKTCKTTTSTRITITTGSVSPSLDRHCSWSLLASLLFWSRI